MKTVTAAVVLGIAAVLFAICIYLSWIGVVFGCIAVILKLMGIGFVSGVSYWVPLVSLVSVFVCFFASAFCVSTAEVLVK